MNNPISENLEKVSALVGETAHAARQTTENAYSATRAKAEEVYATTRAKAADAYTASRQKANQAYSTAQKGVKTATKRTSKELDDNPLAFLVGGVALGALLGALLPRTEAEKKALGETGKKINKSAADAARAAKAAGQKKLDALGISKDAAKSGIQTLLNSVATAASEAGSAATKTVTKPKKR